MFNKGNLGKALIKHKLDGYYHFTVPGHKQNKDFLPDVLCPFDITEIPNFDNLANPSGLIFGIEKMISEKAGSSHSMLLVNGSTAGVLAAMLYTNCNVIARNCHRSAYSGASLSCVSPHYILPDNLAYLSGAVSPDSVSGKLNELNHPKAVIITSPTYEGVISDIKSIAGIVHKHNALLIVDAAHGAHFSYCGELGIQPMSLGADIVVESLHKTLPAMNQLAAVHLSDSINIDKFRRFVNMLCTSSPSYFLMAQAEDMLLRMPDYGDYLEMLRHYRKLIGNIEGISLYNGESVYGYDISKLVIVADFCSGMELSEQLLGKGIILEYATADFALAYSTIADTEAGFQRLFEALSEISVMFARKTERVKTNGEAVGILRANSDNKSKLFIPKQIFSLQEALQKRSYKVKIENAISYVSAEFVIPYPPGVPTIVPGEEISLEVISLIKTYIESGRTVTGISSDGSLEIIETKRGV